VLDQQWIHRGGRHELLDRDLVRRDRLQRLELGPRQLDEVAAAQLVALDDLVAVDRAVPRADVLLVESLPAALVDEVEVDLVRPLAGRVDPHGDRDQAERQGRRVDGARGHAIARCDRRTSDEPTRTPGSAHPRRAGAHAEDLACA
jgi:hypothetical protein